MLTPDPSNSIHPEEHLSAYALDVLSDVETTVVEVHLTSCAACQESVAGYQAATAMLGQSVNQTPPPPALQALIMATIPQTHVVDRLRETVAPTPPWWAGRLTKTLAPMAAALIIALALYNLVGYYLLSSQLNDLQKETTVLQRMDNMTAQVSQMTHWLTQLRVATEWLGPSANHDVILRPLHPSANASGMLLVAEDGRRAMLMVDGLPELEQPSSYHVWLVRNDERIWAGQLKVDSHGRGAVNIHPPEPIFQYDMVRLAADPAVSSRAEKAEMVLEGQILAKNISR